MTFDEVMAKHLGEWDGDIATIREQGYIWKIARKTATGIELLFDGKRYVTTPISADAPVADAKPRKFTKQQLKASAPKPTFVTDVKAPDLIADEGE